jgi:small subunit ribosomal protein S20
MPNIKSAEKRMRQSEIQRLINRRNRSRMRTEIKKFRQLLLENKVDEARGMLPLVYGVIDRAVQKNVVHRNAAARYKSRLTKHLNQLAAAS